MALTRVGTLSVWVDPAVVTCVEVRRLPEVPEAKDDPPESYEVHAIIAGVGWCFAVSVAELDDYLRALGAA